MRVQSFILSCDDLPLGPIRARAANTENRRRSMKAWKLQEPEIDWIEIPLLVVKVTRVVTEDTLPEITNHVRSSENPPQENISRTQKGDGLKPHFRVEMVIKYFISRLE